MPVLNMGLIDLRRVHAARIKAEQVGIRLAEEEQHVVAQLLRQLFGETADLLVIERDVDGDGDTDVSALLMFDRDGRLMWARGDAYGSGTGEIGVGHGAPLFSIGWSELGRVQWFLVQAYDAAGGCHAALAITEDPRLRDLLGSDKKLLTFDITAALTRRRPGWRAVLRSIVHRLCVRWAGPAH